MSIADLVEIVVEAILELAAHLPTIDNRSEKGLDNEG
jgi:hypothetical protein